MPSHTLIFAAMLAAVSQAINLTPHSDAKCSNATRMVAGFHEDSMENLTYIESRGISDTMANAKWYENADFPDAETDGSSYSIWWRVDQRDPSCRVSLFTDYTQGSYGSVPGVKVAGNQILNVGETGCFYSSIPAKQVLGATFCCGTGDCEAMSMGNSALKRRDAEDQAPAELERRDSDWDGSGCTAVDVSEPFMNAGKQQIIGSTQMCNSDSGCTFRIDGSVTSGTTLSSSSSQTVTNGFDASLSVSVGEDFIIKSEVSTTVGYNWAKAVSKETGSSITNSTTFTVSNSLTQKPGTRAFLTFTPSYSCVSAKLDCGGPTLSDDVWQCDPVHVDNSIQGDFVVVYTN